MGHGLMTVAVAVCAVAVRGPSEVLLICGPVQFVWTSNHGPSFCPELAPVRPLLSVPGGAYAGTPDLEPLISFW